MTAFSDICIMALRSPRILKTFFKIFEDFQEVCLQLKNFFKNVCCKFHGLFSIIEVQTMASEMKVSENRLEQHFFYAFPNIL